jgi:LysM repeat protein
MPDRVMRPRRLAVTAALAAPWLLASCAIFEVSTPEPSPTPTPPVIHQSAAPTDEPAPTPTPGGVSYRIRPGDSLSRIATRFQRTVGQILTANPQITDPNYIQVGQLITIPPADAPDIPPTIASLPDATNDLLDPSGNAVNGQAYADFTGLAARINPTDLQVEMRLLTGPPDVDPSVETITYTVYIDTTGDGQPDFAITYGNAVVQGEAFAPELTDLSTNQATIGADFPGTVEQFGTSIRITVSLAALGDTGRYSLAAKVDRRYMPGGPGDSEIDESVDSVPDQQWPHPNARWLTVGR